MYMYYVWLWSSFFSFGNSYEMSEEHSMMVSRLLSSNFQMQSTTNFLLLLIEQRENENKQHDRFSKPIYWRQLSCSLSNVVFVPMCWKSTVHWCWWQPTHSPCLYRSIPHDLLLHQLQQNKSNSNSLSIFYIFREHPSNFSAILSVSSVWSH